ncbi:MAG: hypothetical protein OEW31_10230 [Thermoleophilia bacterium]|nr:hypothetical protein [Thermoleophilia bacterium]
MAIWVALAVLLAGLALGLAFAAYRGICLWRRIKRTGATFGAETDRISRVTGEIQEQLERAQASSASLAAAAERLQASKTRLDVQLAAVREARAQLARTLWFLPGR